MSDVNREQFDDEVLELARKIKEQRAKALEASAVNVREKYPFADASTLRRSPEHPHLIEVDVTCVSCGDVHMRHTGDLKQTKGICPKCKKEEKAKAKARAKDLMRLAREQVESGAV